MCGGDPGI
jgi:hypothetical protein